MPTILLLLITIFEAACPVVVLKAPSDVRTKITVNDPDLGLYIRKLSAVDEDVPLKKSAFVKTVSIVLSVLSLIVTKKETFCVGGVIVVDKLSDLLLITLENVSG
jgi:hypothetical protein